MLSTSKHFSQPPENAGASEEQDIGWYRFVVMLTYTTRDDQETFN